MPNTTASRRARVAAAAHASPADGRRAFYPCDAVRPEEGRRRGR